MTTESPHLVPLQRPCVYYYPNFIDKETTDSLYQTLHQETPWTKTAKINRWVALYYQAPEPTGSLDDDGKEGTDPNTTTSEITDTIVSGQDYKYRDAPADALPFTTTIQQLAQQAAQLYHKEHGHEVEFNVCLLNYYQDGSQRIGWHFDREEIGRDTPIASISLGASREFLVRSKVQGRDKVAIELQAGSCVIMLPACQEHYLHSIPIQSHVKEGRINLTFRAKQATTAGEEEHIRRDQWLQNLQQSTSTSMPTSGMEGGLLKTVDLFGDEADSNAAVEEEDALPTFLIKCNLGTEKYVAAECLELLGAENWRVWTLPFDTAGYAACAARITEDSAEAAATLLNLRSALYVMEYHDHFDISTHVDELWNKIDAERLYEFYKDRLVQGHARIPTLEQAPVTFRVNSERIGNHAFRAPEVEREVGGAMSEFYEHAKPKMTNPDVTVRVDVVGSRVIVGTQVNVDDLSKRHFIRFRNAVTIKCSLAYIMVRLANVQPGNCLVDPFCGSGTILLEALDYTQKKIRCIGMDVSRRAAKGAEENARAEGYWPTYFEAHCADARALRRHVKDDEADAIVTNLPWGVMTGQRTDLQTLYEVFLRSSWYILRPGGRIVMLVLKGLLLTRILRKLSGRYRLLSVQVVRTSNNLPCIVVVEKLERDLLNDQVKDQLAYMSQFVNISPEMYHSIHSEDIAK